MIRFTVPGRAQSAGSKRAFVRGNHPVIVDANPNAGAWKERVAIVAASAYGNAPPLKGPVALNVLVRLIRPKGHWKASGGLSRSAPPFPSVIPDLLKLARAIEDALTGIVYVDDAQIVVEHLEKVYGDRDEVEVEVTRHAYTVLPFAEVAP